MPGGPDSLVQHGFWAAGSSDEGSGLGFRVWGLGFEVRRISGAFKVVVVYSSRSRIPSQRLSGSWDMAPTQMAMC